MTGKTSLTCRDHTNAEMGSRQGVIGAGVGEPAPLEGASQKSMHQFRKHSVSANTHHTRGCEERACSEGVRA